MNQVSNTASPLLAVHAALVAAGYKPADPATYLATTGGTELRVVVPHKNGAVVHDAASIRVDATGALVCTAAGRNSRSADVKAIRAIVAAVQA